MNILFTSAGRRSYLVQYFKEALNGEGVIHAGNSIKNTPAMISADKQIQTPLIYSGQYIPFLINYCKENKIDLIIPLFDIDIPILSRNQNLFDDLGTTVLVPPEEIAEICNDKWKTYEFLSANDFDTPKTFLNLEVVEKMILEKKIEFPLIIKPRWGMGSIGIYLTEDLDELIFFYKKVIKEITNSYLKFESDQKMGEAVIIQEFISGKEHGMDLVNDLNGNFITCCVKQKLAMRSGETDSAQTIDNSKLLPLAEKLSKLTRHKGNMDVDFFEDKDGKIFLLELNARFGGGYPFSHLAGLNLPAAIIKWMEGETSLNDTLRYTAGIVGYKDIIPKLSNEVYYT